MGDQSKIQHQTPVPRPSQGAMQCRECRCLNFNDSDYCRDCEAKRRQTAAENGGSGANGRSHVTPAGVLRLVNPILQAQPRPQAPTAAGTNRNGVQPPTNGGVITPARPHDVHQHQQSNGGHTANARGPPPPRTGFVTPGRSFGPAIYGGLPAANGPKNANSVGPTAARAPTPQATAGARINPPGSSVEPASRAPLAASNIPRNRPAASVIFGPQLAASSATTITSNKRPRIEPPRRTRDVIDLISSDEDESDASSNRREAERLRRQQAISRLSLRGVTSVEAKEEQDTVESSTNAEEKPASAPVTSLVEEEEEEELAPGGLFQSRIFDEITFDMKDFPANDVVVNTLKQHRRRPPSSPASSVATNATTASFDEELVEPVLQAASRAERISGPSHAEPPRTPSVEAPSVTAGSSDAAARTQTPAPVAPQPPSSVSQVSREPASQVTPPQPARAQDPTPAPVPQSVSQSLVPKPPALQPPVSQPQVPQQSASLVPVSAISATQPQPTQQSALQPPAHQQSAPQASLPQPQALQPQAPLPEPPRQTFSAPVASTQAPDPTKDLVDVSSSSVPVPSTPASSKTSPSVAPEPKLIVLDDSDEDEDEDDYSALFQSRIFDTVEFNPLDFSGGEINAGRRSVVPVPPPSPAAPVLMNEQPGTVNADPAPAAAIPAPTYTPSTAPVPAPAPVPQTSTPDAVPTPPSAAGPMRLVVAHPPPASPPQASTSSQPADPGVSGPRTTPAAAAAAPGPALPTKAPQAAPQALRESVQLTTTAVSKGESETNSSGPAGGVNVLQPRNKPIAQPATRSLKPSTSASAIQASQSPIIKREHPAKPRNAPVTKPALGYCSPDLLQFMRESMYDEDDADDDEELARARLLQVVDLTNSTDESDEDDDEEDYFEIVEQRPAGGNVRPALGDVTNSSAFPLGTMPGGATPVAGSNPVVVARIKRKPAPRPKEECVLCEESVWIKSLIHCEKCGKYYHKRCAREYGDETVCWNCDLDGMIDDSEVTEDHKKEVVGMFNMLRMSPESDTEANDEEQKEGDEDLEEKADNPGGSSPVSLPTLQGQKTRSMKRWKAFLEVATAPVEKGFEETTNQITTELQDEASKTKYSKGFVTKEIVEQAMAEVVDHYANLQDREERAQREERVLSPSTTASASPERAEPTSAAGTSETQPALVESSAATTKAQATTPVTSTPAREPTLVSPAPIPAASTVLR